MHKEDLALNNLQWLICHKTQPNQTNSNQICTTIWKWLNCRVEKQCLQFNVTHTHTHTPESNWFKWHVNLYRIISCLEVRESRSLYIFVQLFKFFFTQSYRIRFIFNQIHLKCRYNCNILPLRVWVDLRVMAMKADFALPSSPELEPSYQCHTKELNKTHQVNRKERTPWPKLRFTENKK